MHAYFKDNMKMKRLHLWFRTDDGDKRDKWAQCIQDNRFKLKEEIEDRVQSNDTKQHDSVSGKSRLLLILFSF